MEDLTPTRTRFSPSTSSRISYCQSWLFISFRRRTYTRRETLTNNDAAVDVGIQARPAVPRLVKRVQLVLKDRFERIIHREPARTQEREVIRGPPGDVGPFERAVLCAVTMDTLGNAAFSELGEVADLLSHVSCGRTQSRTSWTINQAENKKEESTSERALKQKLRQWGISVRRTRQDTSQSTDCPTAPRLWAAIGLVNQDTSRR